MPKEYVEQRDGGYYIAGTRVSLDSVVYAFLRGESPEGIGESFQALSLEQIFGALAYYTANREIVDRYLAAGRKEFEALRQESAAEPSRASREVGGGQKGAHAAPMRPRFQADADFNNKIVTGLRRREPAVDIWSARDGDVIGRPDPEVLALAADAGRVLLTHDRTTMGRHFAALLPVRSSPGVLIVAQDLDIGAAIEDLLLIWTATDEAEWVNQLDYIPV